MKKRAQNGFTLYELLITMVVIGVVLSFGVPNLRDFMQNSRVSGTANDLHSSFLVARSEAARAKENVTICASADPMGTALCDGTSFDGGWIVFVDVDGDIVPDGTGDPVLKAFPPVDDSMDIATNDDATYFSFSPTGVGRGNVAGTGTALETAMICDDRGNVVAAGGNSAARGLVVTPIGRSTIIRDQGTLAAILADNTGLECDSS